MTTWTGLRNRSRAGRRGFSIVELLVAVIIIAVLATMAIPIVQNRVDQARLTRAQHEMDTIADALNRVEADTGYYVRLFMLNDLPISLAQSDGIIQTQANRQAGEVFDPADIDGVSDYDNTSYFPNTDRLFIIAHNDDPTRVGELVDATLGARLLADLQADPQKFGWNGPYMNWQTDENVYDSIAPNDDAAGDGIPDDPWGNNYMLVTNLGLIPDGDPSWTLPAGGIGVLQTYGPVPIGNSAGANLTDLEEVSDRIAVISLGPNGVAGNGPGDQLGEGDDLKRFVGK